ncbi:MULTISPECIES: hypothetical protein [Arthrobacter]|uniref:YCII-related domain-containing protein n=2 Tax=Arthrobacter TaxID=1663 RepID=A0ABP9ST79_9MICC|nr:hypothetical protein [Arthrobacter ramosus]
MTEFNRAFILVDPKVLSVEAHSDHEAEDHLQWTAAYSKEEVVEAGRVVIGTLHGANKEAGFTVTIGSLFLDTGAAETDRDYALAVEGSEALETLYDFCRQQAGIIIGMLGLNEKFDIPWKAPEIEVTILEERTSSDDDTTQGEHRSLEATATPHVEEDVV